MPAAVAVENLSKRYRIMRAGQTTSYRTLRDDLAGWLRAPWRALGQGSREEFWALKDISFEVAPGEVVGIIGRNGAGKSTLLKILSRITRPTRGRARLRGRVSSLLEVGTGFHPELTGRENLYLSGAILGMTRQELRQQFDEIVAFSGVERFLETPIKRYSSGMNVRLGFAVAAHLNPKILLVDEVLAVGDFAFQKKCLSKMQDVAGHGRSVLFVSHNLGAVSSLCSRVVVLEAGRVRFDGLPKEAISTYVQSASADQSAGQPLDVRRDSFQTNSPWRIVNVEALDSDGEPLQTMATGDCLRIRIHYQLDQPIPSAGFRLRILTEERQELFRVSTDPISGFEVPPLEAGSGHIDCVLPRLPLTGGTYLVDVGLTRPMIEIVHDVETAAVMHVEGGDFYGSGQIMTNRAGFFVIDHFWSLQDLDEVNSSG